jgi:hypothetical protein
MTTAELYNTLFGIDGIYHEEFITRPWVSNCMLAHGMALTEEILDDLFEMIDGLR